jgi:signal peptidase I
LSSRDHRQPWLAATLSLLLPGLGHIYARETLRGAAVLVAAVVLFAGGIYYTFLPAAELHLVMLYVFFFICVHLYALVDSHNAARRHNERFGLAPLEGKDPWLAALLTIIFPTGIGHFYAGKVLAGIAALVGWALLQWSIMEVSQWLFPMMPVYTVLVALHAHYAASDDAERRRGLALFAVVALVILLAVTVALVLAGPQIAGAMRAKFESAGFLLP